MEKNKVMDILFTAIGCVLIIIALLLSKFNFGEYIVNAVFSAGVLCETIYKVRVVNRKKRENIKCTADIAIVIIYIIMMLVVWF